MAALRRIGATSFRCNLYPGSYLAGGDWDKPSPQVLGPILDNTLANGLRIEPFLFELYASYKTFGTYSQWLAIGKAFAAYGMPGGEWARNRSAPAGFGIRTWTVANEPDATGFAPGKSPGPGPYLAALTGLAAGVRAACPECLVSPGGFKTPNAFNDMSLTGLGPLIAPLYNNGTLHAIDLHTYADMKYAPYNGTFSRSAQADFDGVRHHNNITAPVRFTATEFNYKNRNVTEAQAASGLFTAFFDNAAVVDDDSRPAADLAFPWNIYHTEAQDGNYGLAARYDNASGSVPTWVPTERGAAYWRAVNLTAGLGFESADPRGTGITVLADAAGTRRVWVWQNRRHWSSRAGQPWTVAGLPAGARRVGVAAWSGWVGMGAALSGALDVPPSWTPEGGTYVACARAQPADDGCKGLLA